MTKDLKGGMTAALCAAVLLAASLAGAAKSDEPMSDSWITAKTKMSLAADDRVKGRQVSVETRNGEVMLRGKVDSEDAKMAAEDVARRIDNVKGVKNELQVVAPSRREETEETDETVATRVEKALKQDEALRKANPDVKVNAGVVTLTGEASDMTTKSKASWIAWKVKGVKSVTNDMTVKEKRDRR